MTALCVDYLPKHGAHFQSGHSVVHVPGLLEGSVHWVCPKGHGANLGPGLSNLGIFFKERLEFQTLCEILGFSNVGKWYLNNNDDDNKTLWTRCSQGPWATAPEQFSVGIPSSAGFPDSAQLRFGAGSLILCCGAVPCGCPVHCGACRRSIRASMR